MKYSVTIAFSILQTIEVEADSREEAMSTAWDLFDQNLGPLPLLCNADLSLRP